MAFLNEQGVERLWHHVVAKIEKSGGTSIPITTERPADLPANSLWFDIDEPTPEGGNVELPDNMTYYGEEEIEDATAPLNADTLGGYTVDLLLNKIYPVGSIYMSLNSADPANLFGGTWERIKDTFLLAAGDIYAAGNTGGEAEHTLTESELPALKGSFQSRGWNGVDSLLLNPSGIVSQTVQSGTAYGAESDGIQIGYKTTTISFGDDQPHNNMPPYFSVYMWQRIA